MFLFFRNSFKPKVSRRVLKITAPSTSSAVKKEEDITDGPKIKSDKPKPLKLLDFVITGKTTKSKDELMKEIILLGGNVKSKVAEDTAAVIATPADVEKMVKRIQEAQELDIHVVSEDFVEEAKGFTDAPIMLIKKKSIAPWGSDPQVRCNKSIATVRNSLDTISI